MMKHYKYKKFLFHCLLFYSLLFSANSFSQSTTKEKLSAAIEENNLNEDVVNNKKIDSLLRVIDKTTSDTEKIKLYLIVCELCAFEDNLKYSQPVFKLTDKLLPLTKEKAKIKRLLNWRYDALNIALLYYQRIKLNSSDEERLYKDHIKIALRYNDYQSYSNITLKLADFYFKQGNILKRLRCLEDAYEKSKSAKEYKAVARMLIQLAFFYAENNDTISALDYLNKAIENEKRINDKSRTNRGYIIRGNLYRDLGKYDNALKEYKDAITVYTIAKDTTALSDAYRQMGYMYQKSNEIDNALTCFNKGEELAQLNNDFGLLVQFLIAKGDALASLGRLDEAIEEHLWLWNKNLSRTDVESDNSFSIFFGSHLAKDYVLAKQYKNAKLILDKITPLATIAVEISNLENLSYRTDSALGNYKEALKHYYNFIQVQIKLTDAEVAKAGVQRQFKADMEKQKVEQEKQKLVVESEKKKQRVILYAVSGGLFLLAVLAGVIFRSLFKSRQANKIIADQKQEVEHQKVLVEEKQKEIIDSIAYAKRLQQAILPPKSLIDQHLSKSFIYYRPKDIVAGDFYWAEKINDLFFIAAADSTGHGVPGAMVSVVCSNALNRAVKEFSLVDTGSILSKTRDLVIETFAKSNAEVKDGMDISLLCLDKINKRVFWSGANNPLWYIHNNELKEIKADKQPIGKTDNPKPFTTHELNYEENITFYLFTDGYADQFGGPKGKKFKYKQLEELLLSIQQKPLSEQLVSLNSMFEDWKGSLDQVDDICVFGIKT